MEYFYDEQLRKYLVQFSRLFAGFITKTGKGRDGSIQNRQVPIHYGDITRMVAHIIKKQSENSILSTPVMSFYVTNLNPSPERRQNPVHIDRSLINERKFNNTTNQYENTIGDRFTVERLMPVPYDLSMQLDIYTSNANEKFQIIEQILMLFNPSVDLQTSSSPLDWTALTYVELLDDIVWDSRQIPVGDTETISVASLKFKMPIWISPPANVTRRKAVETIITNLHAVNELPDYDILETVSENDLATTFIITPYDYRIEIKNFKIRLTENLDGVYYDWSKLENAYTDEISDNSILTIKHRFGDSTGITGKIEKTSDPKVLNWVVDPADLYDNTIPNVDLIIDPSENYPGDGKMPDLATGQRYLLAADMPVNSPGWALPLADRFNTTWGQIEEDDLYLTEGTDTDPLNEPRWRIVPDAKANDIIEYNGTEWVIVFSSTSQNPEFVTSSLSNTQYRWSPEISEWQPTIDKVYYPGTWQINFRGQ
ncbi:MAG: tail sheath stabilizer and completion protein [Gammaproteobacteria bacterium]|nr:tail sheath stabilizer and completion protein [Gammaproteobacteria bacterium]